MSKRPFKILSLDGGGIRGIYAASFLAEFRAAHGIEPIEVFDMIAGTSTGAILAAALATNVPASAIVNLYEKHGKTIFGKSRTLNCGGYLRSRFDKAKLETALREVLPDRRMGDITIPLMICASDVSNGSLHVFKSPYVSPYTRDGRISIVEAVLASCAAPTYFDPHLCGDLLIADGGLWANNPSLAAVIDAKKHMKVALEDIRVLSLGTGTGQHYYRAASVKGEWGLTRNWRGPNLIETIMNLQTLSAEKYTGHLLGSNHLRVTFETDMPLGLTDLSKMPDLKSRALHAFANNSCALNSLLAI